MMEEKPKRARKKRTDTGMSNTEAKRLREATGKSRKEWAALLQITLKTVINIENKGPMRAGKQLERIWRILAAQLKT
jgi:DNA-binding transcriptional regulator YiaG